MSTEQEANLDLKKSKEPLLKPTESNNNDELSYKSILLSLIRNSLPTILYFMTMFGAFASNIHFIGIYNDEYLLDGVGIGTCIMNCTTIAMIISLNVGLISIGSQCYGAKNYRLFGIYLHRALILNTILLSLCFIGLIFVRELFNLFNIPGQTADYATTYIHFNYVMIYLTMIYDTFKSYLMAQGLYLPPMIIQACIAIFQWTFCYIFVDEMSLKIPGLSIALTICQTIGATAMFLYTWISNPCPESWFCFNKDSFKGLWQLLKSEVPIGAMIYLEWITYEITLIFSGSFAPNQMGAQVVVLTLISLFNNIPTGLSVALNSMVGRAIGEKNALKSKKILKVVLFLNIFVIMILELLLNFLGETVARFFSPDSSIIEVAIDVIHIYSLVLPFDATQFLLGGYIRGIGREEAGSLCFVLNYYMIGIPLAFTLGNILGFYDEGLWCGLGTAIVLIFISFSIIVLTTDLEQQIIKISNRLKNDEKGISEVEVIQKGIVEV